MPMTVTDFDGGGNANVAMAYDNGGNDGHDASAASAAAF